MLRVRLACLVVALCCSSVFVRGQRQAPAPGSVYTIPVAIAGPNPALAVEEGLLFVPENRTKPGSRIISVHFLRLRGTGPGTRPPIFLLPGGPGGFWGREGLVTGPLRLEVDFLRSSGRDVVIVNQRGNPAAPFAADMRWPVPPRKLDEATTDAAYKALIRNSVTEGLETWTKRGFDPSGYDILNITDDVNDLRKALGYQKIILRGGSFGSQWSFAFLKRYPQFVDRALMHGIEPLDYGYDSPAWLWAAIERVSKLAGQDAKLRGHLPADGLSGAVKTVLARLEAAPQRVTITDPRTNKDVIVTIGRLDFIQGLLYPFNTSPFTNNLAKWPRFVLEIFKGDYRFLAAQTWEDRTATTLAGMLGLLIDNSLGITKGRETKLLAEGEQQWVGKVHPWYMGTRDLTPTPDVGDEFRADFDIQVPVVLLQGDVDFSTPLENALHAKRFLRNGRVVVVEGGGTQSAHLEIYKFAPEVKTALQRFLTLDLDPMPADLFAGLPERVKLPPPAFEAPEGPSFYDRWLSSQRGGSH